MNAKTRKTRAVLGLVRPGVRELAAYHVDETPVRVKLDAMENPFPLPAKARTDISRAAARTLINRYPDPGNALNGCVNDVSQVRELLQRHYGFDRPAALNVLLDEGGTKRPAAE